jgi:hypothetical protein
LYDNALYLIYLNVMYPLLSQRRYELTDSVPSIEELERFTESELREKLLLLSDPHHTDSSDTCCPKGDLAALLHQALKDKKVILDSVDSAAYHGRVYPNQGMTGLGPRAGPGSGDSSATAGAVVRVTGGGGGGGRESLIYLSRQIEQARDQGRLGARDMMPYQHRHLLFGTRTGEIRAEEGEGEGGVGEGDGGFEGLLRCLPVCLSPSYLVVKTILTLQSFHTTFII